MTSSTGARPTVVSLAVARQRIIVEIVHSEGQGRVGDLAQRFGKSTETIRLDIRRLNAVGLVQAVHGGALPPGIPLPRGGLQLRQVTEIAPGLGRSIDALTEELHALRSVLPTVDLTPEPAPTEETSPRP